MKNGIDTQWEEITPAKAVRYLETMNGNRNIRQTRVDFYAAQMKSGLWRPTHQGIAFDAEGHMVDGQHRMWAIVESETTQKMMVSRGLSSEDVIALDTTLGRNFSDIAHYAGWNTSDPLTGSIAKTMVLGMSSSNLMIPAEVQHEWYEFHKDAVDFALHLRATCRTQIGQRTIGMAMTTAFARAHYTVNPELLRRMGEIIKTGRYDMEADKAAFVLRDAWLQKRLGTSHLEQYEKTEAAIRAFAARRAVTKLQRADGELYPVPALPKAVSYSAIRGYSARKKALSREQKAARIKESV